MAENEKIIPEAEEAKAEKAKAEEAEEVKAEAPAEEAPAEEVPAEEVPAEEVKPEEVKADKKEKKAGGKKGILIGGIIVAVVVVLALALTIGMDFWSSGAFESKDYATAYNYSRLAMFQSKDNKNTIAKKYVTEVLCKEGKYFTAAKILDKTTLSDEEKSAIYAAEPQLALCVEGQVVKFGQYETDNNVANGPEDLEWIVLNVKEDKDTGRARALLVTKDVVGSPEGWNKYEDGNTSYASSNLNSWCEDFYSQFTMYDASMREKILRVAVSTQDSSTGVDSGEDVAAYVYALGAEELEEYFVDDLAQYITASPTAAAKAQGVTAYGKDKTAVYYLRNVGKNEDGAQWATGVNKEGVVEETLSITSSSYGARVCINVDLGEVK